MQIEKIVAELKAERRRLDKAITALDRISGGTRSGNGRRGRRKMSAAARKRISQAQKARWAAQRK